MEAKDTVIKPKQADMIRCCNCGSEFVILYDKMRLEQAEISFKAGKESLAEGISEIMEQSKQAGIKEVVEWMKSKMELTRCDPDTMAYFNDYVWVDYDEWKAQLKEWGIK